MPAQLTRGQGFLATKDPPRQLKPMREPAPAPVMGDPLSVPETDVPAYPAQADRPEPEPLWLKLPADLAPYFDLGFCHTDEICPYVVLRVRDEGDTGTAEVSGPAEAFLAFANVIATLCGSVPCLTHSASGEAARYAAG